ncbi:MAG: WbuC family cupin fold metalloprotein [Pseudomonadota bacterium]
MTQVIDSILLNDLSQRAAATPRGRLNHNLHPSLDDPIHRFCNALEPGTYLPPHRHPGAERWELMVVLRGCVAILIFDDTGRVIKRIELRPQGPNYAVEIPGGAWHALTSLAQGSVILEIKHGPYLKVEGGNLAKWAPPDGAPQATLMEQWMRTAQAGMCVPRF